MEIEDFSALKISALLEETAETPHKPHTRVREVVHHSNAGVIYTGKGISSRTVENFNQQAVELSALQHTFESTTFVKPTFCRNCDKLLVKGVRCATCKSCFHHKGCGQRYPNVGMCPVELEQNSKFMNPGTAATLAETGLVQARQFIPFQSIFRQIPFEPREHNLQSHTYKGPTGCAVCGDMLLGVYKQGLQCVDCSYNVHESCCKKVLPYCTKRD